jgi:class 3 adenylate cyclase
MSIDLSGTLENLSERTKNKFAKAPKVIVKDEDFDVTKLPIGPTWHRLTDAVAVVFDLKSSTNLEAGRSPASTASIYDAGVGGVVKIFNTFDADFVDIQGDGGFALFWGDGAYERALCAAITVRKFSWDFANQLEAKWPNAPTTGFKIGVASGPVLAKLVGLERHLDLQEPVWAGRPVNFAAKAAQQQDDADHISITASVWDAIESNDYLTFSCGCVGGEPLQSVSALWFNIELEKIPTSEKFGQSLGTTWCDVHGDEFCSAILAGETRREGIPQDERSKRTNLGSSSQERILASKDRAAFRKILEKDRDDSLIAQLAELRTSEAS